MTIRKELMGELIATSGGSLMGPDGLAKELMKIARQKTAGGYRDSCHARYSAAMASETDRKQVRR